MGFVISKANVGKHTAGTDTGVIPCPLVSARVREEDRKGRQTEPRGERQGWERRVANHAEQRELKPYAFSRYASWNNTGEHDFWGIICLSPFGSKEKASWFWECQL